MGTVRITDERKVIYFKRKKMRRYCLTCKVKILLCWAVGNVTDISYNRRFIIIFIHTVLKMYRDTFILRWHRSMIGNATCALVCLKCPNFLNLFVSIFFFHVYYDVLFLEISIINIAYFSFSIIYFWCRSWRKFFEKRNKNKIFKNNIFFFDYSFLSLFFLIDQWMSGYFNLDIFKIKLWFLSMCNQLMKLVMIH